jgi:prevent-host-death family protein
MRTVAVSEAKAHLSELLREVETRRERVLITRRGRNVAWLIPAPQQPSTKRPLDVVGVLSGVRDTVRGKVDIIEYRDQGRKR